MAATPEHVLNETHITALQDLKDFIEAGKHKEAHPQLPGFDACNSAFTTLEQPLELTYNPKFSKHVLSMNGDACSKEDAIAALERCIALVKARCAAAPSSGAPYCVEQKLDIESNAAGAEAIGADFGGAKLEVNVKNDMSVKSNAGKVVGLKFGRP
jgi:hypothetical protein